LTKKFVLNEVLTNETLVSITVKIELISVEQILRKSCTGAVKLCARVAAAAISFTEEIQYHQNLLLHCSIVIFINFQVIQSMLYSIYFTRIYLNHWSTTRSITHCYSVCLNRFDILTSAINYWKYTSQTYFFVWCGSLDSSYHSILKRVDIFRKIFRSRTRN
jgi:hypothetical protein